MADKAFTRCPPTLLLPTLLLPTLLLPTLSAEAAYDAKGKRDPFVSLLTPEGVVREPVEGRASSKPGRGAGTLTLEGIVYDPHGGSIAIIGGDVFRMGEVRGGVEVLTIEPSKVIVLQDGLEHQLELPSSEEGGA